MLEINLHPFPVLQTSRLNLRQVTDKDAPEIFFQRSNDATMQYLDREKAKTLDDALAFIKLIDDSWQKNNGITWGITELTSKILIGTIGLYRFDKPNHRAEIGYQLHPDFWQQGLMNEAMHVVLDYGFRTLHLHSIAANINPNNLASRKLLEKNGFVQEAHFRQDYYFQGKFLDSVILSLLTPSAR